MGLPAATGACPRRRGHPGARVRVGGSGRSQQPVPEGRGASSGSPGHSQSSPTGPGAAGLVPSPRPPPPGVHPPPRADRNRPRSRRGTGRRLGLRSASSLPQCPAPLPCSPAGAGEKAPRRLAGGRSLRASLEPDEGSPRPPPAPRPRPRARCPQSLRPARGRTLAECRRSGPGCATPASTCPTSGATAQRQRRAPPPRPAPPPRRGDRERAAAADCASAASTGGWAAPPGRRLDGRGRSPAPPGPTCVGSPRPSSGFGLWSSCPVRIFHLWASPNSPPTARGRQSRY